MQVNPQEVSAEKATTAAADLRLVSVKQLQKIHRELDACQKVIWQAGCRPRVPNGFDPAYVTGAQEQLKAIDGLINAATIPSIEDLLRAAREAIKELVYSAQQHIAGIEECPCHVCACTRAMLVSEKLGALLNAAPAQGGE